MKPSTTESPNFPVVATRRCFQRWLLAAVAAPALAPLGALHAQPAYPGKPLKLIVPFAPGGAADIVARALGAALGQGLQQTVVIDNRGGAGSVIGTDAGAKAAPDGYTLTLTNGAAITTGPLINARIPYQPLDDFVHVFLLGSFANMLVVRAEHPAKSFKEFVAMARADKGGVSWGSAGVGSAGFLAGELLAQLGKLNMVHVPYKGTGPAMNDLLGGTLAAMFTGPALALPQIKAGRLRALAVSSEKRSPEFPDVPTMNELVPGAVGDAWFGIAVPAKTPPAVVERLRSELERSLKVPELQATLRDAGMAPLGLGPVAFEAFLRQETAKWTPVIRNAKITAE